jgi:hypothetical protein
MHFTSGKKKLPTPKTFDILEEMLNEVSIPYFLRVAGGIVITRSVVEVAPEVKRINLSLERFQDNPCRRRDFNEV